MLTVGDMMEQLALLDPNAELCFVQSSHSRFVVDEIVFDPEVSEDAILVKIRKVVLTSG